MEDFRVKFKVGEQKKFMILVKEKTKSTSLKELHKKCSKITLRSLKNYYSGYCFMPYSSLRELCLLSNINIKRLEIELLPKNWGFIKGGKKSMKYMQEKYKDKFSEWRKLANKNSVLQHLKKINYPALNEELAEFIGIYLGDGTITEYVVRISGDSRYDLGYFLHISALVKRLFNLDSKIATEKGNNALLITIYSKQLCSFLRDKYGINFGDKIRNQTCIPQEIFEDKKLALACLRGLVDTDGCISRRGRNGSQFCVQFFNSNKKLLGQVREIGFKYGFFSYFTGEETGTNKWSNVEKYFREVGSSNLKHIVRFNVRSQQGETIYLREVLSYYGKPLYKNIQLPFKI